MRFHHLNRLTRRDFVRLGAVGLGSAIVTACDGPPITNTPLATIIATLTPEQQQALATALPTLVTLTPEQIVQMTATASPTATLTATPTATMTPTATPTAIPSATPTPRMPGLRDYADRAGKEIGVEALGGGNDQRRFEILKDEFNQVTITAFSWVRSRPAPDRFDLEIPRAYAQRAQKDGQIARAQQLVWGNSYDVPREHWLRQQRHTREQLIDIMKTHIRTVMHDKQLAAVKQWVVVNEGSDPSCFWFNEIGPDFVEIAFQTAREADSQAELIYNDGGFEYDELPYARRVFELAQGLKKQGLVDSIGMQMHFLGGSENPDPDLPLPQLKQAISSQMKRYADLGLAIHVTELDVDLSRIQGSAEERIGKASGIYAMVAETCLEIAACKGITLWGINASDSWILDLGGTPSLLFDGNQPQPPYQAMLEVLRRIP